MTAPIYDLETLLKTFVNAKRNDRDQALDALLTGIVALMISESKNYTNCNALITSAMNTISQTRQEMRMRSK